MMYLKLVLAVMVLNFIANSAICRLENSPKDFNHIVFERNQFGFIFTTITVNCQTAIEL